MSGWGLYSGRKWAHGTSAVVYCEELSVIGCDSETVFSDQACYKLFLLSTFEQLIPEVSPCIFGT
jgi:hypothetical protein